MTPACVYTERLLNLFFPSKYNLRMFPPVFLHIFLLLICKKNCITAVFGKTNRYDAGKVTKNKESKGGKFFTEENDDDGSRVIEKRTENEKFSLIFFVRKSSFSAKNEHYKNRKKKEEL